MRQWEIHTQSPLLVAVSRRQAAMLLDISPRLLQEYVQRGKIAEFRPSIGQHPALIEVSALQEYLYWAGYEQPEVVVHVHSTVAGVDPCASGAVSPVGTTRVVQWSAT